MTVDSVDEDSIAQGLRSALTGEHCGTSGARELHGSQGEILVAKGRRRAGRTAGQGQNGGPVVSGAVGLSVILVNFNDRAHLGACLGSVRAATRSCPPKSSWWIIIRTTGVPGFVREAFPWVDFIVNDHNAGFAKGNNAGIRASSGRFVLFLNTDTVVPADAFAALLAELDRRPEAGAIGPALVRGDSSFQVSFGKSIGFIAQLRQEALPQSVLQDLPEAHPQGPVPVRLAERRLPLLAPA